jgi:hypothetical protein
MGILPKMNTQIIKIKSKEWSNFQPYLKDGICSNNAFPSSLCFGLFVVEPIPVIASMVWYTMPFFHTDFRSSLIPELRGLDKKDTLAFINKNVRLLARISTLPKFRGNGFAFELVQKTIALLNFKYIECLTAHDDVRSLLKRLAFSCVSACKGKPIDYWLYRLPVA